MVKYGQVELLCKAKINGASGYDLLVDGVKVCVNVLTALDYVSSAAITNAVVVNGRYLRLKPGYGSIEERTVVTTTIIRNGISYINPLVEVIIEEQKFTKYLLNVEHADGKNKAFVFNKVLGYNLSNYRQLIQAIRNNLSKYPITRVEPTAYGIKYGVDMMITGIKGRSVVITGWIEVFEGRLRLTTAYIKS